MTRETLSTYHDNVRVGLGNQGAVSDTTAAEANFTMQCWRNGTSSIFCTQSIVVARARRAALAQCDAPRIGPHHAA
jgi:hypothetical protein